VRRQHNGLLLVASGPSTSAAEASSGVVVHDADGLHPRVNDVGPTNLKPRRFSSFEMRSDRAVLAGSRASSDSTLFRRDEGRRGVVQDDRRLTNVARAMTKRADQKLQAWIDARKRHRLSDAHVQMAREPRRMPIEGLRRRRAGRPERWLRPRTWPPGPPRRHERAPKNRPRKLKGSAAWLRRRPMSEYQVRSPRPTTHVEADGGVARDLHVRRDHADAVLE
jgi:hypothetical protein